MKLEHIAIWTDKLEEMKEFYEIFFQASSNEKYINEKKQFESYFLTFESGARIELMRNNLVVENNSKQQLSGYAHIAFSLNSREKVDELTNHLTKSGYEIISAPRLTGDGYYESCFLDPDGNVVELTA